MSDLCAQIQETVDGIRRKCDTQPEVAVILGTGLGTLADEMDVEVGISYTDIFHFPVSTVETHAGKLLLGKLGGKSAVAMQGRFHYYEGYAMAQITFPVRVMRALGAQALLVSNACGGMNPNYRAGDLMVIEDHINLQGDNPLIGVNDNELGPRFPDMSAPYDAELIALAERVALDEKIPLQKGVYVAVPGPNLETRAEYRFLRAIGADVVGMSTVPEVIVAVHGGMRVLGLSVVTDECFPDALKPADIGAIIETANRAEPKLTRIMQRVIEEI